MPVRKVKGGYKWGKSGKVYKSRIKELGDKKAVEEWDKATGDRKLPKRVKKGK